MQTGQRNPESEDLELEAANSGYKKRNAWIYQEIWGENMPGQVAVDCGYPKIFPSRICSFDQ
jgi:hypothetical protein